MQKAISPIFLSLFRVSYFDSRWLHFVGFLILATVACSSIQAQQTYVSRYDVYAGFADLNSTALGLNEVGFHTQAGVRVDKWLTTGLDYSITSGSNILKPDLLPTALQQQLGQVILGYIKAGVIPPTYQLTIPTDVVTQSYTAGGELVYRHFTNVTLFLRPSLGAFRLAATPHPGDQVSTVIAHALVPSGHKVDWTGYYGFGGGDDVNFNRRFGLRTQMDVVYSHPFNDILANGFWTIRYSIGPTFNFGRNILASKAK